MTGANGFTRTAGFCGLLSDALVLVALLRPHLPRRHSFGYDPWQPDAFKVLLAVVFCLTAVTIAGLVVRHWGYPLARWAGGVLAVSIVVALATGNVSLGQYGMLLLMIAVYAAGELPRAAVAMAAGTILDEVPVAIELVALAGWIWLAWAMWREPIARHSAEPVPAV